MGERGAISKDKNALPGDTPFIALTEVIIKAISHTRNNIDIKKPNVRSRLRPKLLIKLPTIIDKVIREE